MEPMNAVESKVADNRAVPLGDLGAPLAAKFNSAI